MDLFFSKVPFSWHAGTHMHGNAGCTRWAHWDSIWPARSSRSISPIWRPLQTSWVPENRLRRGAVLEARPEGVCREVRFCVTEITRTSSSSGLRPQLRPVYKDTWCRSLLSTNESCGCCSRRIRVSGMGERCREAVTHILEEWEKNPNLSLYIREYVWSPILISAAMAAPPCE